MLKTHLLWIGDHPRLEFARILRSLTKHFAVQFTSDIPRNIGQPTPSIICFAHSRPGQFRANDLEELRLASLQNGPERRPTPKFLHVLGESCCGLKRTSQEFGEVPALYSHEFPADLTLSQLLGLMNGDLPQPSLSYSNADLVAIYSPSKSFRRGLADSLAPLNLKTIQLSIQEPVAVQGVDFVVWDVANGFEPYSEELAAIQRRHPAAKIVALLTYPRENEVAALAENGVQVLAQPFPLSSLFSFFRSKGELAVTSAA